LQTDREYGNIKDVVKTTEIKDKFGYCTQDNSRYRYEGNKTGSILMEKNHSFQRNSRPGERRGHTESYKKQKPMRQPAQNRTWATKHSHPDMLRSHDRQKTANQQTRRG
jgi:hypothetical protein